MEMSSSNQDYNKQQAVMYIIELYLKRMMKIQKNISVMNSQLISKIITTGYSINISLKEQTNYLKKTLINITKQLPLQ